MNNRDDISDEEVARIRRVPVSEKIAALDALLGGTPQKAIQPTAAPTRDPEVAPVGNITVLVETLEGTNFSFVVDCRSTIAEVKKKVSRASGAEPSTQAFFVTACNVHGHDIQIDEMNDDLELSDSLPLHYFLGETSGSESAGSSNDEPFATLTFCLLLTPTQVCVRIWGRVHFLPVAANHTVFSLWEQLMHLGVISESVALEDGELMFQGKLLPRESTLQEHGVIPRSIHPDEHALYSRRALGILGTVQVRKSTLHVLIPGKDPNIPALRSNAQL